MVFRPRARTACKRGAARGFFLGVMEDSALSADKAAARLAAERPQCGRGALVRAVGRKTGSYRRQTGALPCVGLGHRRRAGTTLPESPAAR